MENNNTTQSSSGITFTGLLQIAFIVLKLVGTINWSWWWVLSPILSGVGIGLLLVLIIVVIKVFS